MLENFLKGKFIKHGVPILIYDKLCAGSKSYSNFTDEFLKQENIMESAA